jgi:PST family polysaccharide transporter
VQGIAWTGAVKWGAQLLSWLGTIVVARLLNPEDFGLVAMAGVLLGLVAVFNDFGLGAAVVAMRNLTDDQIARIHGLSSLFGVAGFILVCLLAIPMGQYYGAPEISLILMTMGTELVLVAMRSVPDAVLKKELHFKFLSLLEGWQATATILVTISLAWWGAGYWALVGGRLLGSAGVTSVIVAYRPLRPAWPSMGVLREVIRFSSRVLVSRVAWFVSASSDLFIAGWALGGAILGTYSFAVSISSVPMEKVTALASRVMPSFYSTVQHDVAAMRRYFLTLTEGLALITFPLAAGMAFVAQDFVSVALGDKWTGVIAPLQILAGWAAVRSVAGLVSPLLYVTGGSRVAMLNGLFCMATYPMAFWIGSRWGTVGLAVAWVLVQPPSWIAPYRHVLRAIHLSPRSYLQAFWPALSGVLIMGTCVYGVQASHLCEAWSPISRLVCEVSIGAAAYVGTMLLLHRARIRVFLAFVRVDAQKAVHEEVNEAPRSKLRGITELNFEDFSEAEANPVASYGESQVQKLRRMVRQSRGKAA